MRKDEGEAEVVEVVFRSVVMGGEELNHLVSRLAALYGPGSEIDILEETLVFHPQKDTGNMNYINREVTVTCEYRSDSFSTIKHIGSSIPIIAPTAADEEFQAYNVRISRASNINIRRTFLKAGFSLRNDFAKKGLEFVSRIKGLTVFLSRPYNANLLEASLYLDGAPSWETLPGPLPFESDYLLEVKHLIQAQSDVDASVALIQKLVSRFSPVSG